MKNKIYTPEEIINYWYSERVQPLWFNSTPEFDAELKERFEPLVKSAAQGELSNWLESPEGCLALVIVLDQFPLNIYRGKPESFSTEKQAVNIARHAVERGYDKKLPSSQLAFLYMPFMHSESMADQDLSVQLFTSAGLKDNAKFAEHHRDIVRRFGRFPHRNKILGRQNSQDELEYLNSKGAFKG